MPPTEQISSGRAIVKTHHFVLQTDATLVAKSLISLTYGDRGGRTELRTESALISAETPPSAHANSAIFVFAAVVSNWYLKAIDHVC